MSDLAKLLDKFPAEDIEWRLQQSGEKNGKIWAMCLAYITNRAIMDRLDKVVGPENWKNEFTAGPHGGVLCGISILVSRIGFQEWLTKWDGAENTDIEAVKGGLSGAMKRAAVQWGIGRYLYDLDEGFAEITDNGKYRGKTKDNKYFKWNPPKLPIWALPPNKPEPINASPKNEVVLQYQEDVPEPKKSKNFAFLQAMGKEKARLGEETYYKILGEHGYEKSTEITDRTTQEVVYKALLKEDDKK